MRKLVFLAALFAALTATAQTSYEKAWDLINQNKWGDAARMLDEAASNASTAGDAFITRIYLKSYMGAENEIKDFGSAFYGRAENPYPYIYAMWFNQAVVGPTGKKDSEHQLNLLRKLLDDNKAPGTLHASVNHQLGMHYVFSNELSKSKNYFKEAGNIRNWQFTGPFENISHSGFYKEHAPIQHPEPTAVFKSKTNADVKWFSPSVEINDAWTPVTYQFSNSTAVVFAQTFVTAAEDMQLYCCTGTSGSVKVWINDKLVVAEAEERITELDTYISSCQLKKGVNRVLVQLGYTDNSYANFSIRFTDPNFKAVKGLTSSPVYAAYPKQASDNKVTLMAPFAENYFKERIAASPKNLVNYLLLADVYERNNKVIEARKILTDAISIAPDNCLLKMKMAEVLIKEENRTLLLEEVEKIKKLDPGSVLVMDLNMKELLKNQKYNDLSDELQKRIRLYGDDESTADYKLALLVQEKKYEELVKEVERLYNRFPRNTAILSMMYTIKKEVYKDNKAALGIYEKYLKDNYNYKVVDTYADELAELGKNDKALDLRKQMVEDFPYSPHEPYQLSRYYYGTKDYDKADKFIRQAIDLSPYNENYWEMLGDVYSERKKMTEALDAYNRSLQYDPNQYEIINKIRKLNGKKEAYELLKQPDIEAVLKADDINKARNTDYGYYYVLDQKDVIVFPGGATEEYYINIIRITNEKGVDTYKESSIPYGNNQSLLIEKAQIIKKNGSKLDGEKSDNEIVFTNLEPGDAVVFKYRLRNYNYGRLSKHFWDYYYFGGQIYTAITRYNILMPSGQPFFHKFNNHSLQPVVSDVENFKKYSWELVEAKPEKDEPVMPLLIDVAPILHVSTIDSWNEIANWYSDISNTKEEEAFEITALYNKLFPATQKKANQFQAAKKIYDYIQENIRYSSVSFRQSAYVPQRPAVTLTTRLGDCKDLSSLFVTLARMAGINAQLVLIDTRDNGQQHILLPGVEFNHCIVKTELDSKTYYLELTDNYLPFGALPNNDIGATILEIPYKTTTTNAVLKFLQADHRQKDIVKRKIDITALGSDLQVTVKTVKYGTPSSGTRYTYRDLDNEKLIQEFEKSMSGTYKNNLKMQTASVKGLNKLEDSVEYQYTYVVKNEVAEIGTMKTFRIVYPDVVATMDKFSADTRTYPVAYWNYEDVDQYETVATITAPTGTKFVELPASENLVFKNMKFSLQYTLKNPTTLVVTRKFSGPRQNVDAADYPAFKEFFEKIIKAEQKFIAFK
jgi:predicted Zn-dependent protease